MAGNDVKKTGPLTVLSDPHQGEEIVYLNPNDALDLGLMLTTNSHTIVTTVSRDNMLYGNLVFKNGSIIIKNECREGTVEVSLRFWEKIGKIQTLILAFKNDQIYLINA